MRLGERKRRDLEYRFNTIQKVLRLSNIAAKMFLNDCFIQQKINMKRITKIDADFIVTALNQMWNDAHEKLQRKDLDDIERKNYEYAKSKSKELIDKLDD